MAGSKNRKAKKVKRPVVRGPQLALKVNGKKIVGKAKGEPPRTARVRYIEPPHKVTGNPFFAVRIPRELLRGFRAWCNRTKTSPQAAVRGFMSKVTGIELEAEGDNND